VTRSGYRLETEATEGHSVAVVYDKICESAGGFRDDRSDARQFHPDGAAASAVVGMRVGTDHEAQLQAELTHLGEVPVLLLQHWINENSFFGLLTT